MPKATSLTPEALEPHQGNPIGRDEAARPESRYRQDRAIADTDTAQPSEGD